MNRREFSATMAAAVAVAGVSISPARAFAARTSATQSALIFDAMGEIRPIYSRKLIKEILDSGINAITVTLGNPKTFEQDAYDTCMDTLLEYNDYFNAHPDLFIIATKASDIALAKRENKLAVFYLTQNSAPFGRDLNNVDVFYNLGMRSAQITYNYQNWAGAGCKETSGSGLTIFGHALVEKMNDRKMLIDLSHSGPRTMSETIAASKSPVIISHTCCEALNSNLRNTSDANMKALADKGGIIGICQMRPFMTEKVHNAVNIYYDHILHAIKVAGIDHVAIGSDRDHRRVNMTKEYIAELKAEEGANFDDSHWPLYFEELNGPRRMEVIWDGLKKRGLKQSDLEKVMGLNVQNIYKEVL